jgi:hypothetical protein
MTKTDGAKTVPAAAASAAASSAGGGTAAVAMKIGPSDGK